MPLFILVLLYINNPAYASILLTKPWPPNDVNEVISFTNLPHKIFNLTSECSSQFRNSPFPNNLIQIDQIKYLVAKPEISGGY